MAFRAVVIGSGDYPRESGIVSYSEIGESARHFGLVLDSDPLWRQDGGGCRVLTADEVRTPNGVMTALEEEADRATHQDVLVVVYVGHGALWKDVPDAEVHFAVGSSHQRKPWTWLSSWYVYRVMRQSKARMKVLIADCCYSNQLKSLGGRPEAGSLGVIGQGKGTCLLTAVKGSDSLADPNGCPSLSDGLAGCTPFSGHLLDVLRRGTDDYHSHLTLGLLRDAVEQSMAGCDQAHHEPRMLLNDAHEKYVLATNRMDPADRRPRPGNPVDPDQWVATLLRDAECDLEDLLRDADKTGEVVARLSANRDERWQSRAQAVADRAFRTFRNAPDALARYVITLDRAQAG
ncbi:hypothetical protein BIV57_05715 [Mangrovactinospora gilvigrisea]|uniref:Caspase domain-containing protein n=1 Tax=Mangrovactinospora gilvigrisea TaxID=1428644 RepID=A0A1J7CA39_9ACTN|nr:caspase family protein [Mangrovactinospora gilvigrisea]OIV38392.1 hypothetical protein BIV57_05715 [Mangrovactinospora gilvigrisea]